VDNAPMLQVLNKLRPGSLSTTLLDAAFRQLRWLLLVDSIKRFL